MAGRHTAPRFPGLSRSAIGSEQQRSTVKNNGWRWRECAEGIGQTVKHIGRFFTVQQGAVNGHFYLEMHTIADRSAMDVLDQHMVNPDVRAVHRRQIKDGSGRAPERYVVAIPLIEK